MEADSYCRTLKCLCWDLLQKTFSGLPSFPFPSNAALPSVLRSGHSMLTGLWAVSGGCQHGRLWAGRSTAREATSEQGQPLQPPWKPQPGTATLREPAQLHCSAALLPHPPLGAGWSRHQEHTHILVVLVPLWSLSGLVLPSMALTSIQPCAWLDTSTKRGEELKNWRELSHISDPYRLPHLGFGFSRVTTLQTQGHCHRYHCAPEHP